MMDILGNLKHAVFTDDGDDRSATPIAPPAPVPPPSPSLTPLSNAIVSVMATVADDNETYQKLKAGTDFEATDVATQIHKCLDPLSAIPDSMMSPQLKFKTALIQAKAQFGVSEDQILGAFETLKVALADMQKTFNSQADNFSRANIGAKQRKLKDIGEQIIQLETQQRDLIEQVAQDQKHLDNNVSEFNAAFNRRSQELDTERAQYAALLKG